MCEYVVSIEKRQDVRDDKYVHVLIQILLSEIRLNNSNVYCNLMVG